MYQSIHRSILGRVSTDTRSSIDRLHDRVSTDVSTDTSADTSVAVPYKIHDPSSLASNTCSANSFTFYFRTCLGKHRLWRKYSKVNPELVATILCLQMSCLQVKPAQYAFLPCGTPYRLCVVIDSAKAACQKHSGTTDDMMYCLFDGMICPAIQHSRSRLPRFDANTEANRIDSYPIFDLHFSGNAMIKFVHKIGILFLTEG